MLSVVGVKELLLTTAASAGQLEIKDAGTVVYFVLGADKPSGKFITFSDSAEGDKSGCVSLLGSLTDFVTSP